ncbi:DUF6759 domain-containing protein [Epilithonimonas xixisoli]|uniref:DUF6759 domain-containing protein n=1 Tax=Epilithonimonas xixisoli TaxID=1476462 RepID=UPI001416FE1E|nr:DUF6759 domain-containing protein [Epilithonimonas xixisoli]
MASTNIFEISNYLKNLQQDDPQKKAVLNRLKQLKNGSWKSEPRLLISDILNAEKKSVEIPIDPEKEEFHILMKESAELQLKRTVMLLNNIFNTGKEESETVLFVRNDSSCDIILRLQGKTQYNLPVPSKGENFININKDSYIIKGKICNSEYLKRKDLTQNQMITLKHSQIN